MTGVEPVLVKLGQAVVTPAVRRWLADRRSRRQAAAPLSELLDRRIADGFSRRRFDREVEAMADAAAERFAPLIDAGALADHERRAALDAVVSAFTQIAASDEVFFAADADPTNLSDLVRAQAAAVPEQAGLTESFSSCGELSVVECVDGFD